MGNLLFTEHHIKVPRIRCAVCDKQVDKIEWFDEFASRFLTIKVYCHGSTDTMKVPREIMVDYDLLKQIEFQEGVAFDTVRIEDGSK